MAAAKTVSLSSPERVLYPEDGITKGEVFEYYRQVGPTLVPHLKDRPFTMKRYPDGWQGRSFFRKDVTNYAPAGSNGSRSA